MKLREGDCKMKIIKEEVKEKALNYKKANIFKRFVAFIIDCIMASIIAGIIAGIIVVLILNKILTSYSFPFLIAGAYMLLRDGFSPQNRSIGKRVFNLKPIIVETGGNCDFKTSAKRNWPFAIGLFLNTIAIYHYSLFESKWKFADSLGYLWIILIIIEVVLIVTDKKGRTFGDKMAGTQVIELKKLKKKVKNEKKGKT